MSRGAVAGIGGMVLFTILADLAWMALVGWVVASAVTSGIKAGTESCGQTYSIESYWVVGDWFCPGD